MIYQVLLKNSVSNLFTFISNSPISFQNMFKLFSNLFLEIIKTKSIYPIYIIIITSFQQVNKISIINFYLTLMINKNYNITQTLYKYIYKTLKITNISDHM
jgi:hypothetical protein